MKWELFCGAAMAFMITPTRLHVRHLSFIQLQGQIDSMDLAQQCNMMGGSSDDKIETTQKLCYDKKPFKEKFPASFSALLL